MCFALKNSDILNIDDYINIIRELKIMNDRKEANIVNIELGGHGEPLLYDNIVQAIEIAKNNFRRVSIVTNGLLLDIILAQKILETNIDHIEISMTGIDKEVYSNFQGYNNDNMDIIIQNIKNILRLKHEKNKKTVVSLSYISAGESKSHIKKYRTYWENMGINRVYVHSLIHESGQINDKFKSCYMIGQSLFIHSNGDVKICCYDFKRELVISNIHKDNLRNILDTDTYTNIVNLNSSLKFDQMPMVCRKCNNMKRKILTDAFLNRKRMLYNGNLKTRLKGIIWGIGMLTYEILPPNKYLYKILYYLKSKFNVF